MTEDAPRAELVHDPVTGVAVTSDAGGVSAIRLTLTTPLYRGATLAMFLSGLRDRGLPGVARDCVLHSAVDAVSTTGED